MGIIREIDGILANAHHYALGWDAPFHRIAFWNKFGHPESYLTRVGDQGDIVSMWWRDPERERQVAQGMRDSSLNLAVGKTEVTYWPEFAKREGEARVPSPTATR